MHQPSAPSAPVASTADAVTQRLLSLTREIPPIVRMKGSGPRATRLKKRTNAFLFVLGILGALPTVMAAMRLMPEHAPLQAFCWGLWLPGAGFVAIGGWAVILFPVTLVLFRISLMAWSMAGMLVLPVAVWILSAVAAYWMTGTHITFFAPVVIPIVTAGFLFKRIYDEKRHVRQEIERGKERTGYLPSALAELDLNAVPQPEPAARELSPDELDAARYMFDLALQPVGEFTGFTMKDNIQLAALRYQLNYISYGLAGLQCKYTPNFHGYLNRAQRFAIESLTLPKVCGYWKLESMWGSFRWHPDPIDTKDNVMLTGWSLIALSTYAANTGDLRYQEEDALRFKPFANKLRTYGHNAHTFAESLVKNWNQCPLYLFPCEPFWSFPICNALAFCGVVPYDRVNGTDIAVRTLDLFVKSMEEEFLRSDGNVRPVMSTLTGWTSFSRSPPQIEMAFLLWMARVTNAIHPGHAKRWYALVRKEFMQLEDGDLSLKGIRWEDCFDTGNYKKNPGFMLANIAMAAREHGDDAMADAAIRKADQLLTRVVDKSVNAFDEISTAANLNLAAARWARRDDWHDLITRGPDPTALVGPVLTDCEYPAVLVARAVSDGVGLDLVLYNGAEPGHQSIKVERLTPDHKYTVSGATPGEFITDANGSVVLRAFLSGRTPISIARSE